MLRVDTCPSIESKILRETAFLITAVLVVVASWNATHCVVVNHYWSRSISSSQQLSSTLHTCLIFTDEHNTKRLLLGVLEDRFRQGFVSCKCLTIKFIHILSKNLELLSSTI